MIMNEKKKLQELYLKRKDYQEELENLHMSEPGWDYYKSKRFQLEYNIAFIDDVIDHLERELKMRKTVIISGIVAGLIISGLLTYIFICL